MEENSILERQKFLEQELRIMSKNKPKKKVPPMPKRMASAEQFDNSEKCNKDVILMVKKRRATKSPITYEEKCNEFDNGKKRSPVKQTSSWKKSESPVAYKEPHKYLKRSGKRLYSDQIKDFNEPPYDYIKKYGNRRSVGSPDGSTDEYDYWKKSEKKRFLSPTRDEYDYLKKFEKMRNIQSPNRNKPDYWKKYQKGHSTDSPDRDEYNYRKKYEKKRSIGSPAFKENTTKALCGHRKKYKRKFSFESPTTSRKSSSNWKKHEKRHVIDLRSLIKGKTSGELVDNSKKHEKFLMIDKRFIVESPPTSKGSPASVLTDNLTPLKSRHYVKSRTPDELLNYSKECGNVLMAKKRHKVASPASSDENSSDELINNAKKSKKILLLKERRKAKSPAPSEGSSSVEIIEVKQPEKKSDMQSVKEKPVVMMAVKEKPVVMMPVNEKPIVMMPVNEKPVVMVPVNEKPVVMMPVNEKSDNSYFATPVSSSKNFDRFESSIQHNECGSSESTVAQSTKFCENCKCLMAPNQSTSPANLNCSTPVASNTPDRIGYFVHNDAGFYAPSSFCNANIACSITGGSFMPKMPPSGQNIRIVCTPSYPESLNVSEKYNYFQNRRVVCTPNYSESFKFQEKYAYFKNQGMKKTFSPYHYYAPKEIQSQYTWKRPQSGSTPQWQRQPSVTKEQLDSELDNYMSEVKFKQLTAKQDDVEPFVEEYMLEVEKCLNKHYTMDTFN